MLAEKPAPLPTQEQISSLQEAMKDVACDLPETLHYFAPGLYARKFSMPAGMTVVGMKHKHEHLLMVARGAAAVVSEFGREILKAGYIGTSKKGVKRVVYALTDVDFITLHHNPDNNQDIDDLEHEHVYFEQRVLTCANKEVLK